MIHRYRRSSSVAGLVATSIGRGNDATRVAYLTALEKVTSPSRRLQRIGAASLAAFVHHPAHGVYARAALADIAAAAAEGRRGVSRQAAAIARASLAELATAPASQPPARSPLLAGTRLLAYAACRHPRLFGAMTVGPIRRAVSIFALAVTFAAAACQTPPPSKSPPTNLPSTTPRAAAGDASQVYPGMASLAKTKPEGWRHACGAAVLTGWYVVTAAHCVTSDSGVVLDRAGMRVRTGTATWAKGGQVVNVAAIHVHPRWDRKLEPPRAHGDLALLRLASKVDAEPLPLAADVRESAPTRLLGWGATPDDDAALLPDGKAPPADVLHEFDVVTAAPSTCTDIKITDGEVCVQHPDGAVPCHGDSGGPVLQRVDGRWYLVGVISHGYDPSNDPRCPQVAPLSAHTDLTDPGYQSWIRQIVCTPTLIDSAPCRHWNHPAGLIASSPAAAVPAA